MKKELSFLRDFVNPVLLVRIFAVTIFCAVIGGVWDAWRHDSGGFESVLSPAHLVMYLSAAIGALVAFMGFTLYRSDSLWRRIGIAFALVIVSAPFDQLWHVTIGLESIGSPWLIWSPPHALLLFSVISASAILLRLITKDPDPSARRFFGSLVGAALCAFSTLLLVPFVPTGPYHVIGVAGSGIVSFVFILLFLCLRASLEGVGAVSQVAAWTLMLAMIGIWPPLTHSPEIPAHVHLEGWILVFSFLVPVALIDLAYRKLRLVPLGAITGALLVGLLLILGQDSFIGDAAYSFSDILTGTCWAALGGACAGYAVCNFYPPAVVVLGRGRECKTS